MYALFFNKYFPVFHYIVDNKLSQIYDVFQSQSDVVFHLQVPNDKNTPRMVSGKR